ncbi:MAG TPA: hypothetical protein VKA88_05280 [Solirubrobacterales bacterium]|nr:hypothetical protein [Solirubrobacterales bacterium]
MDEVSFELAPAGEGFAEDLKQIRIEVNGTELPELVREVELPAAREEGDEALAGGYVGLVPGYVRVDLASQFLGGGGARLYEDADERTQLLGCGCGEVGCSPLLARITVTDDTVTWQDFEQPQREDWDYSDLGPFTFDRAQYERALFELLE